MQGSQQTGRSQRELRRPLAAEYLGEKLQAAGEHGVDAANAGEVEGGGQLLLAHAQAQQVARRDVAQQDLLEQVV